MLRISSFVACVILCQTTRLLLAQDVKYEKYQLPNGLTVILHEDHSLPVATINTWYYVGSKDEVPGRSGFAHLFEHLMFMGTERVPGSDFDNIMEAAGGFNNASTSEDRTNYFSYGPSNLLETLLWLDADRLQDLGRMMNQEKLDKQREVVLNERRQSYENQPYGNAELRINELMYPSGHPYHIPVIGTHEDIAAATVDDVKQFFARFYVPNNASLVVAGDFDPAAIKPVIAKLFGTLPRGNEPIHHQADPVKLDRVIRNTMSDTVQYAKTYLVYHSPAYFQDGDAEMDLAAAVLSSGISSRLYQELVYKNQLATEVNAFQSSSLLGSLFYIEAIARPGIELNAIEEKIDAVVEDFKNNGPTAEELSRHKATIEFATVNRLQSLSEKADTMNRYQFYFGEPNSFKRDLDRYRDANIDGVRDWSRKVLTPDARLILRVLPELETEKPDPRDERIKIGKPGDFKPLLPAKFALSNGIQVYHFERRELPLVEMRAVIESGSIYDSTDRAGLAALTADMLDEGAGERGAIEFSNAADLLGASLSFAASREYATGGLSVLRSNFEPAVQLFADAVQRPRFEPKEFQRVQELTIDSLRQDLDNPVKVANLVGMQTFFGADHPYGRPITGSPETIAAIELENVRAFYSSTYAPARTTLLVAGDLTAEEAKQFLEKAFGRWSATGAKVPAPEIAKLANKGFRVVLVDKPEAVQTVIRYYMPAPAYGDPNRVKLDLLNTILGGSFTSRLNQNLREEHGYTYGAGSRYVLDPRIGYFIASSSVQAEVTGESVKEFVKEFSAIRGGDISAEETTKAQASFRTDLIQNYADLGSVLDSAITLIRNNRPFDAAGEDLKASQQVGQADLNSLAKSAIPYENALLILVGDRKLILEQTKGLGLKIEDQ